MKNIMAAPFMPIAIAKKVVTRMLHFFDFVH